MVLVKCNKLVDYLCDATNLIIFLSIYPHSKTKRDTKPLYSSKSTDIRPAGPTHFQCFNIHFSLSSRLSLNFAAGNSHIPTDK